MDAEISDDVPAKAHVMDVEMADDVAASSTVTDLSDEEMDSVASFVPLVDSALDADTRTDDGVISGSQMDNDSELGQDSTNIQGNASVDCDGNNHSGNNRNGNNHSGNNSDNPGGSDNESNDVSSHSIDINDGVTAISHENLACDDKVNDFSDASVNEMSNDTKVNEAAKDNATETCYDRLTDPLSDKVKDISADRIDEPTDDKSTDSSAVSHEASNDKVTDICDKQASDILTDKVNNEIIEAKGLDDKTGQVVVSENNKNDNVVIIDDEGDVAGKDSHREPGILKDRNVNEQTNSSLKKTDQDDSNGSEKSVAASVALGTIISSKEKMASVSTSKVNMMLQQEGLRNQVVASVVPAQQQRSLVAQPTVQQLINRSSKQSNPAPVTEPKKLTVWAQSLIDIGFDIVKSTVLQDFISLQNKKLESGELPDAAKTQLEKFKKNHDELCSVTEHLNLRMSRRCTLCRFRTESSNVMQWHQQHPHTNPRGIVSCSHCTFTTRNLAAFNFHMQTDHMGQAYFERELQKYECPLCHFEGSSKTKFQKHRTSCDRTFQLFTNLCPTSSHVTYCLHDGMFIKLPPSTASTAFYNLTNVSSATQYKLVNPPTTAMSSMQSRYPPTAAMSSMQSRFPASTSARPPGTVLNRPIQQNLNRQVMFPVQPARYNSAFTGAGAQQQGVSPIILSHLNANPSLINRFVTGANNAQYNLQIQQQFAQLQQLQAQNAQAMQMLKQQQKPQAKNIQPMLYNQVSSVINRANVPNIINRSSPMAGINRMNTSIISNQINARMPNISNQINARMPNISNQINARMQATAQSSVSNAKVPTLNMIKQRDSVAQTNPSRSALIQRPVATPANSLITCEVCEGFVKDRNALRVHLFYAHQVKIPDKVFNANDPPFRCGACRSRFWSGQGLIEHKSKCKPIPAKPLVTTPVQTATIQQSKITDTYTCIICYRPVTMLLNHMKSMHDLALADFMLARKCVACGLVFNTNELLNTHMSALHGFTVKKPHSLLVQTKEDNTPLAKHAANYDVHKPVPAVSTKWPNITSSSTQQQQKQQARKEVAVSTAQLESESAYKSYKCVICKINFDSNVSLTRHCLTFHSNCEYCGMIFPTINAMRTHCLTVHSSLFCKYCGMKFPNVNSMCNHVCIRDPRYRKCEICHNSMKNKSYRNHIETKHLKKCSVTLKRLSEEQIERYRKVKRRRLNAASVEEVSSTALHQNGFYKQNSKTTIDNSDIVVIDDTTPAPGTRSPRRLPIVTLGNLKNKSDNNPDTSVLINGDVA